MDRQFHWRFGRGGRFYLLFKRGGTISFNYFVQNYASFWLEYQCTVHAILGGLVVEIKIFGWCGVALPPQASIITYTVSELYLASQENVNSWVFFPPIPTCVELQNERTFITPPTPTDQKVQ